MEIKNLLQQTITGDECALKERNVRLILKKTFKAGMAEYFWQAIKEMAVDFQRNYILTWKLCQLIHRALVNGSPDCHFYGCKNIAWLSEFHLKFRNLSSYLIDNYDKCIENYLKLLITKLKFHQNYKKIPNNFSIKQDQWDKNFDLKTLFQLSNDMFDFMDDINNLQNSIFSTNLTYTIQPVFECRFLALSTVIEETKVIYFLLIKIMHNLHLNFNYEHLADHRTRFQKLFTEIKRFFDQTIKLNLLQNIIWIPKMSDEPPEFNSNSMQKWLPPSENSTIKGLAVSSKPCSNASSNGIQTIDDVDHYYDSDFDTDSSDGGEETCAVPSLKENFEMQKTSIGRESPIAEASASILEVPLKDKEEIIRKLRIKIIGLEDEIHLKDFEIKKLKTQLETNRNLDKSLQGQDPYNEDYLRKFNKISFIDNHISLPNESVQELKTINSNLYRPPVTSPKPVINGATHRNSTLGLFVGIKTKPVASTPVKGYQSGSMVNLTGIRNNETERLVKKEFTNHPPSYGTLTNNNNYKSMHNINKSSTIDTRSNRTKPSSTEINRRSVNFSEAKSFWANQNFISFKRD